jgi:PAS domain S-box-containing protein
VKESSLAKRVTEFLRRHHLWILAAIIAGGTLLYYIDRVPFLRVAELGGGIQFTRYATHRILSILPVAYAAFVYGLRGGLLFCLIITLLLLPRVLIVPSETREALIEVGAFFFIGSFVTYLIDMQRKEKAQHQETIVRLRASEESYRGLFENAGEAILVLGLSYRIIAANKACEKLTGYTREELLHREIASLLSERSLEVMKDVINRQLSGETMDGPCELVLTKKDGTEAIAEFMASPIFYRGEPTGVQIIARDVTEQRRMQNNLRYYISQVIRAQENERLRIARELHDDTAQALVKLSRRLDDLASGLDRLPKKVRLRIAGLHQEVGLILEGVRRFSQDLRPSILDDLGLLPALKWLATDLGEQGIAVEVSVEGAERRLPSEVELALFRIAQEALNNVKKHSRASRVDLTVRYEEGSVTLSVDDDGQGFRLPERIGDLAASGKLGLIGMQERARLLGGTFTVRSEPGKGTSVVVTLPLSEIPRVMP